jgi:hypothetical protein
VQFGLGSSDLANAANAVTAALGQAREVAGGGSISFVFFTDCYNPQEVFQTVKKVIGTARVVGACVPGLIAGDRVLTHGVSACVLGGDELEVVTCFGSGISDSPDHSGRSIAWDIKSNGLEEGTLFIFPDGFASNVSKLLRSMYGLLGPDYTFVGGGTGDNLKLYRTYQFTEQGLSSDSAAVAAIRGASFRQEIGHGWRPSGQPMIVTRAEGKRVFELDGIEAFKRYAEAVGGISREQFACCGMKFPLGVPCGDGNYLIRDPLRVEANGSIIFVTEVPQNTVVVLMETDTATLIETAGKVASRASAGVEKPKLAMVFDCISRYLLLGDDFGKEVAAIRKNLEDVPWFGVLTFGEISSVYGSPFFHNKTLSVVTGW